MAGLTATCCSLLTHEASLCGKATAYSLLSLHGMSISLLWRLASRMKQIADCIAYDQQQIP